MPYDCVLWGPNPLIESWDKLPLEVDGVNKELVGTNVKILITESKISRNSIPIIVILYHVRISCKMKSVCTCLSLSVHFIDLIYRETTGRSL